MTESNPNNSWRKELRNACSDLSSGNSIETFGEFLDNHAEDLELGDLREIRSRLVVAIRNKTGHKLAGGALKAHALKCSSLTTRINELIDGKAEKTDPSMEDVRHQENLAFMAKRKKAHRNYKKPPLRVVKPKEIERIEGELKTHTYKGVEVLVVEGFAKKEIVARDEEGKIVYEKDEDEKVVYDENGEKKKVMEKKKLIQVITMQGGRLKGVSIGCVYEVDKLPKQLRFAIFPEQEASYLAQKRAEAEAKKAEKKQQANPNKQKEKEARAKSKKERKQARKNAA